MNIDRLKEAVRGGNVEWLKHSLQRMMERGISRNAVKKVLLSGDVIEYYPEDKPYPSTLFFGKVDGMPLHVVAAYDPGSNQCYIITAYRPDKEHFEADFKTRRRYG